MGDKLKQLEIKKLLLEYSYLLTDEELKDEIIDEYQPQFMESFLEKTSEIREEKEKPKHKEEEPKPQEKKPIKKKIEDELLSDETKKRLKTMFRDIMKKTHPDKVDSEELVHFYVLAKEAYEENNIVQLAFVAQQINVNIDFGDDEIGFIKQLIKEKQNEVKGKETSWLWLWYKAEGQEELQEKIMNTYVNKKYPNLGKKKEMKMEELKETLEKMYKMNGFSGKFSNKTEFKSYNHSIYGEVTQEATDGIVDEFGDHFNKNTVFYDLGCGVGKMVAHVGLQYNPKKSCGIEFSKERFEGAKHIKETYCKDMNNISYINESFLNCDISDATVVYCDNTMYDNELTKMIIDTLPEGCLFICRRKPRGIQPKTTKLQKDKFMTTYKKNTIHYLIK